LKIIANAVLFERHPLERTVRRRTVANELSMPDSGHDVPGESGETMNRRPRRNHTPAFKATVALAAIKGDRTLVARFNQFERI
jgi:hypothetical protein